MSRASETIPGKHPKQDFQVERIAFFSDAVFAIAITLLIIEFRPPHVTKESSYAEIWTDVLYMKYKLGALLVSFALIVNYWTKHHTLFKHIHNYNASIIRANMWLLLPVIFFPFTTSFLYESLESNYDVLKIPYRLFLVNNVLANGTMFYLYHIVTNKYKAYTYAVEEEKKGKMGKELLLMAICFTLAFALSFISFNYSAAGLAPIFLFRLYNKFIQKKKPGESSNAK